MSRMALDAALRPGKTTGCNGDGRRAAEGEVWWMLDGRVLGQARADHPFTVSLARDGRDTLTVMDSRGRYDRIEFEIAGVTPR